MVASEGANASPSAVPLGSQEQQALFVQKRQALLDLVDYAGRGQVKFNEALLKAFAPMLKINLEVDPWPRLELIYLCLLQYVATRYYIDQQFILKLLNLFDAEDPRERDYLKTILHQTYKRFTFHRPFIREAIGNAIYQFIESERHNGIAELLEVLGGMINKFVPPLKEKHKQFLDRVLVPLHKPECVAMYHEQLSYCITQFVEKDPKLADSVLRGLLKFWPLTNSQNELLFLEELEKILELTQAPEFEMVITPLFQQIARCLSSSDFEVVERTLRLWDNDYIVALTVQNRATILPLIFAALERNARRCEEEILHTGGGVCQCLLSPSALLRLMMRLASSRSSLPDPMHASMLCCSHSSRSLLYHPSPIAPHSLSHSSLSSPPRIFPTLPHSSTTSSLTHSSPSSLPLLSLLSSSTTLLLFLLILTALRRPLPHSPLRPPLPPGGGEQADHQRAQDVSRDGPAPPVKDECQHRFLLCPTHALLLLPSLPLYSPSFPMPAVNGLTINVRKMFLEMDQPLYEECQRQLLEEEGRAADVEEVRAVTWQRLEEAADSNTHSQGTTRGRLRWKDTTEDTAPYLLCVSFSLSSPLSYSFTEARFEEENPAAAEGAEASASAGRRGEYAGAAVEMEVAQPYVKWMASKHHPHLVRLLGYCIDFDPSTRTMEQLLVYELMPNGDLERWIGPGVSNPLSLLQRLDVLIGVAKGLQYLHDFKFVHRDIKPANILLDKRMQAKVADFGLVKLLGGTSMAASEASTRVVGTLGYMDPEYYESQMASPAADVYSFGMVMLVVVTGRKAVLVIEGKRVNIKQWVTPLVDSGAVAEFKDPHLEAPDGNAAAAAAIAARGGADAGKAECSHPSPGGTNPTAPARRNPNEEIAQATLPPFAEPLPLLKDVGAQEQQALFIRKLRLCSYLFDFNDPMKNVKEKEIKRQTLLELVGYTESSKALKEIRRMLEINLFRPLTRSAHGEMPRPTMEAAWPHLELVYEFLLRYVVSEDTYQSHCIDQNFILKLLNLFDSEDPRERECVETSLNRIYDMFNVHRPFIREAIGNIVHQWKSERRNSITEIFRFAIVTGFELPLGEKDKEFLGRALFLLHKPRCLPMYHHQLPSYCIIQFVEKDPELAEPVLRGLLKFWPLTDSQKEVLFLEELEEVLKETQLPEFEMVMTPLFQQIARCLSSSDFQAPEYQMATTLLFQQIACSHFEQTPEFLTVMTPLFMQIARCFGSSHIRWWNNDCFLMLVAQNSYVSPSTLPPFPPTLSPSPSVFRWWNNDCFLMLVAHNSYASPFTLPPSPPTQSRSPSAFKLRNSDYFVALVVAHITASCAP
ncbi:unnamed protein product [Closterium sp. Naga37s-1]|nr:unnamed protein product [Closterium sp. Naga37s-1]